MNDIDETMKQQRDHALQQWQAAQTQTKEALALVDRIQVVANHRGRQVDQLTDMVETVLEDRDRVWKALRDLLASVDRDNRTTAVMFSARSALASCCVCEECARRIMEGEYEDHTKEHTS